MAKVKENYQTSSNTACPHNDQGFASKNITPDDCHEILRSKTGNDNFELISYELIPAESQLGYLGDYFKLTIYYKSNEKDYTLHCFSKFIATANELVRNVSQICFKKEEFMYRIYIPLLNSLGFNSLTSFAPECYFSKNNEVIVMEDLSLNGFTSSTLSKPASSEWLLLTIKQLAKLHACSILCEQKLSKQAGNKVNLGDVYKEYLQETNFAHDQPYGQCMTFGVHYIYRYLIDKLDYVQGKLSREQFKEESKKYVSKVFRNLDKSDKYTNVICHRDMWVSNVLMKKNDEKTPSSCTFVDYQLVKYCPPAIDVLFVFYINTDRITRRMHMADFLKEYYDELDKILKKYETNISDIFSFHTFLKSCEELKSTSICQSLAYLQILLLPKDVLEEINNNEEKAAKYYDQDRKEVLDQAWLHEPFRVRMTELLEELYTIFEKR